MFKFLQRLRSRWNPEWQNGAAALTIPRRVGEIGSAEDARTLTPFEAALQIYETAVGSLPIITYQRKPNGGRVRLRERPEYKILHDRPNLAQTRAALIKQLVRDYWLQGECFCLVRRDRTGKLFDLTRIAPMYVTKVEYATDLRKTYTIQGEPRPYTHDEMIHVVRRPGDDLRGEPMLDYCSQVLGLHKQIQDAATFFYENAARPSMYGFKEGATTQQVQQANETWRQSFKNEHQGIPNTGSVPFINWKLEKFPRDTAEDAGILNAMQLGAGPIGQLFNLDAFILGDLTGAKYNSLAAEREARYSRSFRPVLEDFELEFNDRLFTTEPEVYAQFNIYEILRGSPLEEAQVNQIYVQTGVNLVSEVRERLDLDFIPGTDQPMRPLFQTPTTPPITDTEEEEDDDESENQE